MTDEELTRQLAERVMGWRTSFWVKCDSAFWDTEGLVNYWIYNDRPVMQVMDFKPLTNIVHAWMVVERMREKGYTFSISGTSKEKDKPFEVGFWNYIKTQQTGYDKSICRAIGLAALAAVEEE